MPQKVHSPDGASAVTAEPRAASLTGAESSVCVRRCWCEMGVISVRTECPAAPLRRSVPGAPPVLVESSRAV